MKHSTFLAALCVLMCSSLATMAQNVLIPDSNFKSALVGNTQINSNGDSEIQVSEAANFTGIINVPNLGIRDLTGIEAFTSITRLYCNNNLLTSINITQNTALIALRCNHNALTALDVSNNVRLTDLRCYVNQLGSLDIRTLANLEILQAFQNRLIEVNTQGNPRLREVNMAFNQLKQLNLDENRSLTYLDVKQNDLRHLQIHNGNNVNMTYFNALRNMNLLCVEVDDPAYADANWHNVETGVHFSLDCSGEGTNIVFIPDAAFKAALVANREININGDTEIQYLEAGNYHGSIFAPKKHIFELTGLEAFTVLRELHVYENDIEWIDLRFNTELRVLRINDNPIPVINLSTLPHLTTLMAHNTPLTSLDLSANPELTTLWCFDSQLASLDLTHNNKLVDVQLNHNRLTSLRLGEQPNLKTLLAYRNQLTSIDVSQAPALVDLRIQLNKLNAIDLAVNSSLRELNVGDNLLTGLDLTGKPGIRVVDCYNNQLTTLDISQNPTVFALRAYKNKLTELNVKNGNNRVIRTFDVTRNPNLTCIQVDDPAWSEANWTMVDPQANFSVDCGYDGPEVVNIPDANFRERLYTLGVDTNGDRLIQYTEARAFTAELMLVGAEISDATGVEAFINVSRMNWEHNNITKLDLRFNSGLKSLSCGITPLTDLQVNPQLELLECYSSPLTSLNLYNNNSLKYIDASDTQLEGFNLGDYPFASGLEFFAAGSPRLVHLNLTAGVSLTFVGLGPSILMSLDLSRSTNLKAIRMSDNSQLSFLNIKTGNNANMTEFSLQNHPVLDCIEVDDVEYAEENFDVEPHTHFSTDCDNSDAIVYIPDPAFKQALVGNDQINMNFDSEIQKSEANNYYGELRLANLGISDLTGIEEFINIETLDVSDNNISRIILANHDRIGYLAARNNQINALSVYACDYMIDLDVRSNRLESILLPPRLEALNVSNNLLTSIYISAAPLLRYAILNNNRLTDVEVTEANNQYVEVLNVESNQLTWLNIEVATRGGLGLAAKNNSLTCIQVDDPAYAEANWRDDVDPGVTFSENCEGDPNIVYIPDPNLKELLVSLVDGHSDDYPEPDGEVQGDEAANYYGGIYASGLEIRDLTGVGAFYNAGFLDCSNNLITRIDEVPSSNQGGLDCSNNQITEITTSLSFLSYFNASHNRLTELPELNYIYELLVDHNELTSIDGISTENYVGIIHAEFNKITSVDFGNYGALYEIYLNDNLLTSLDITGIYVESTDVTVLNVGNNRLTSLNLKNGENEFLTTFNAIGNPDLTCIQVDDPAQAEADWRDNVDPQAQFNTNCSSDMDVVYIPDPNLKALLVQAADGSDIAYPDNEPDGEVQYFEAREVQGGGLNASGRNIQDVTGLAPFAFEFVDLSNNQITVMSELSGGVTGLDCSNNQISEITADLSSLQFLNASNNQLTSLPEMPQLFYGLLVQNNELTSINIPEGIHLIEINCSSNQIGTATIDGEVETLNINDNLLTSLDVSEIQALTELSATGNPDLTCIEVADAEQAEANWRDSVDPHTSFSEDCSGGGGFRVAVSPNPTMGRMTIQSTNPIEEVIVIDGVSGGLMTTTSGPEVDISHLHNGVYLVKVKSGGEVRTTRIVKQ